MVYITADDSPSAGETYDPREELTPGQRLANQIGGGGDDDDDDDDDSPSTGGYSDLIPEDELNNSESGMPGAGTPTNDIVSPDPNENTDGDEVIINPDGTASVDLDRTDRTLDEIRDNVSNLVGDSDPSPSVDELGTVRESIRDIREEIAGMGEIQPGSEGDFNAGTLGVAAIVMASVLALLGILGGGDSR
ncbi:hypothetical protein C453_04014 [Haloferax elongans ATCC BAA-1513]|uniref:Uncharacterized protein n=1 Tax=Haloferax elongans ATCC BAA-1513 TaxID=1230453 RepID=M0HUY5_HALEO|nr:hypothetical protein [Haloferax elongans]ELZ87487.1 hypothetical protein C453_04014 [Haloferax elongans ATCC BAA-1513]